MACLLVVLTAGCALKEEVDLVFPSRSGKLFVEGYLAAGEPIQLTFIRSSTFQQDLSLKLMWNAQAELLLPDTTLVLQNLFYKDKESGKAVNYVNTYRLPLDLRADSLRLRLVTADKADTLYAATALVEPIGITGWQIGEKKITVTCTHAALPENRYYGIYLEYQEEGRTIRQMEYYDYTQMADSQVGFTLQVPAGQRPYRIVLYRISRENYRFQMALKQAYRSNIDPYEVPVVLPSNIRGGQGIFTFSRTDTLLLR